MSQPWQLRALSYYDQIGEIRFASQFYAKLLSRVRFYPARQLEDGSTEPITSGAPVEILHRIQDPGGGRSRLQYDYGRMMFVTGEGILFGTNLSEEDENWRFLWTEEVKKTEEGFGWQRVRYDQTPFDPPQVGEAYRMWTPHPRHSDIPDSPLHSVMDIAEELLILTAAVRATAVTRLTNGILLLPTEANPNSYGPPASTADPYSDEYEGDEDPETSPFLSDYIEHITAQIENPGSAEARVPFIHELGYEYMDRVRKLETHDPQTDYMERDLRTEAVKRLALGMDFPPEFLLGMTDANHWTARQVVYDMWRSYGAPVAERFGDDLSDAYLRPALRDDGYPDWANVVVAFDDSQVVIAPDRTEDADKAYDRGQLNDEGYLELKGIPLSMRATEEDKRIWLAVKLRNPALLDGTPFEMETPEPAPGIPGPQASQNGNDPEDSPPAPTGGRVVSRQESRTASAQILGAASLALMRCRELAGVRIRHKCPDCGNGHPLPLVASAVGVEAVKDPMKLVTGGADAFRSWLEEQGYAEQAAALCQQLEVYAARTLFQPRCPDLPAGFVAAIERAQEVTYALESEPA